MKILLKVFIVVFLFTSNSLAEILNVPSGKYPTIQAGIDSSINGDTVLVAEDTYYENINFRGKAIIVASQFIMDKDTSHISKTIINGSEHTNPDSGSVVYFISGEDTTSVLCGFTITGGSGTYFEAGNSYGGGGIYMLAGGKILHNRITDNNLASQEMCHGAGLVLMISDTSNNVVIEYNDFIYNSIVSTLKCGGGGIYLKLVDANYIKVSKNFISYNSVTCTGTYKSYGGGLGVSIDLPTEENVVIENNIISNNELHCVASIGAGIYVVYWEPGGEVFDYNPTPLIYNNIISNNFTEDKGGGIGIWTVEDNHQTSSIISPQPAIINNTIVNNSANDGCGIFNFDSYPLLMNNILWNDLSASGSREIFNDNLNYQIFGDKINGGELFVYYSDIQGGWEGEGNIDAYPAFVDTANGDYSLTQFSKCVGIGIDSSFIQDYWYCCPSTDYYGKNRPNSIDKYIDIGAIESTYQRDATGIELRIDMYPNRFNLSQNYPNPFNPSTTIEFTLPKSEFITLTVYNILGKEVTTLVNNKLQAGNHIYEFDGSKLASGVYLYRIESGNFQDVKKMILIR